MKPKILLVGSSHYHELFKEDEPSKEFLKNLEKLRKSLITYNPTKICVEIEEKYQDQIDEFYQSYDYKKFSKREAYDLGFNAGKQCELTTVHAVDWMEIDKNQNGISEAVDWAKVHDSEFIDRLNNLQSFHNSFNTNEDIYEITLELNKPENFKHDQEMYGHMMLLGDTWDVSIPWLTWWYKRNMIMVNNITREIYADSRVIMIVGAGHLYILKQMLESSGKFEVQTFYDWEMNM